ncbi:Uncharacterized membrane protein [Sanguibacter gelidistatuariae]|uniref:Uncharacterized membrane protein n=1 Tax=Sanguibacter gelidistatuariae TaxID=1814289 RepID=A0A1G6HE82_9MICO|nr:DUF1345 domain-containing protein [Sanguibacter gelidistatuariae]SDB92235.1 Uncharacterized membrane protein [Sanguibacter gelidistatuariae]
MTHADQDLPPGQTPAPDTAVAGIRLSVAAVVGVAVAVLAATLGYHRFAILLGWAAAALTFTAWTWFSVGNMDATQTAAHATREEPSRAVAHLLMLGAAIASLVGVGFMLFASGGSHSDKVLTASIALFSVAVSWMALHSLFALGYARRYYTGTDGGFDFHQEEPPRYVDFAYIAFTVGMSFAISDTDVQSSDIRKTVLGHALLSYLFGSVILAATINLIAGL